MSNVSGGSGLGQFAKKRMEQTGVLEEDNDPSNKHWIEDVENPFLRPDDPCHEHGIGVCTIPPEMSEHTWMLFTAYAREHGRDQAIVDLCWALDQVRMMSQGSQEDQNAKAAEWQDWKDTILAQHRKYTKNLNLGQTVGYLMSTPYGTMGVDPNIKQTDPYCTFCWPGDKNDPKNNAQPISLSFAIDKGLHCYKCKKALYRNLKVDDV